MCQLQLWYEFLAEMPPVGESTPDRGTAASDVVDTTVEMPLQVTPEQKDVQEVQIHLLFLGKV